MKNENADTWQRKLQNLRARLTGDVLHLTDEAFSASGRETGQPSHMAELGSDAFEQDVTLQMLQSEESALGEINAALDRLSKGVFGVCERCEKRIPKARLNAIPYARYCVQCATEVEMEG